MDLEGPGDREKSGEGSVDTYRLPLPKKKGKP